jgi:GT2 family glycosyltransferase/glycosyltransferase involved in cell wall biosynthesis
MDRLLRILRALPLLILSPLLIALPIVSLAATDLLWLILGRRRLPVNAMPRRHSASVVVPNWNGRDLLEKYLPSVIEAMSGSPDNEVIVVDNGSTDGSAEFLASKFPQVKVLALPENLGFGGGSNAGFRAAKNDIVVLLNSDMRVAPDFLAPLLNAFTDENVFAVSCQIFFSDPQQLREETGLTQGWWDMGGLRVRHRIDNGITEAYPCFYGGGGSCAFDRRKFLELGGFDHLLRPFYLEDTDLGYLAWKRGWKLFYQPQSHVWHEHRGTIGKNFSRDYIDAVVKKNFLLFTWKNIHEWPRLLGHFFYAWAGAVLSIIFGDSPERPNLYALLKAFLQTPGAIVARWRARSLSVIDDTEAFRRPLGGYFRDCFAELPPAPARLNVLFVSPYPICPPVHGGAVFMYQTLRHLTELADVHLITLLDYPNERKAHDELASRCRSAEFLIRMEGQNRQLGSITPHAIHEFANPDLDWLIHRQIYTKSIDVLQLDYLPMGQYHGHYRRISSILFEHDVYFQSVGRLLRQTRSAFKRIIYGFEYLRALRYELQLLPNLDRVQVCSRDNREYVESFLPEMCARLDDGLRAGIDVARYEFHPGGRDPATMLFLGSFRHIPNAEALNWFVQQVLPRVVAARPDAKLIVIGSDPPPRHSLPAPPGSVELRGFVEDITEPLRRTAVFLCPILSGSGVRVKLLEAFASGIPCVSTRLGAEGIARNDGEFCALADSPDEFASKIVALFDAPGEAAAMAQRARRHVEENWDMAECTRRLVKSYQESVVSKRREA